MSGPRRGRDARSWAGAAPLAACLVAATPLSGATARDFGLALTSIAYGPWDEAAECPQGLALGAEEVLMQQATPALRAELQAWQKKVGSSAAYLTRVLSERRGPNGADLCASPTLVRDPPIPFSQAQVSEGFDLDGGDRAQHCAHDEFVGRDGKPGIDNQVRRLTACMRFVRDRRINEANDIEILSGAAVTLLRVTGVDDAQNDVDVTVEIFKGRDGFVKDGAGRPLPDATMRADRNAPVFQASTKGRIVDGILETAPVDARFMGLPVESFIRAARFRIALHEDGYADGMLGGYFDLANFWDSWTRNPAGQFSFTCPSLYQGLHQLADGHRDPATGKCSSLSVAFSVKAVRTFVLPPSGVDPQS